MKRIAFIFGNTDGLLGVTKDMRRVDEFLRSAVGGAWDSEEIVVRSNLSLADVRAIISYVNEGAFDYVFIYFSGHGGMTRTTNLCLNQKDEMISEEEFRGLSARQLMIFDCCRVAPRIITNDMKLVFDESDELLQIRRKEYRDRYNKLIMRASPQEIRLYACQPNKEAYETASGGDYTRQLISDTIERSKSMDVYVKDIHRCARSVVSYDSVQKGKPQTPDMVVRSEYSEPSDLILAVKNIDWPK